MTVLLMMFPTIGSMPQRNVRIRTTVRNANPAEKRKIPVSAVLIAEMINCAPITSLEALVKGS